MISWTTAVEPLRAAAGTSLLFVALLLRQAVGAAALGELIAGAGYSTAFTVAAAVAVLSTAAGCVGARHCRNPRFDLNRDSTAGPPTSPRPVRTPP